MNIKKLIATVLTGASLLAFGGVASAATVDINVYGASAQYKFWKAYAVNWIHNLGGTCTSATVTTKDYDSPATNSIVYATCNSNTYNIRVASKASYDGILAILGDDSQAGSMKCTSSSTGYPGSASVAAHYRLMVDESTCSGSTCTALKCQRVSVGASDVAASSFTQQSHGGLVGPATTYAAEAWTDRGPFTINASSLLDSQGGCGTGSSCAKPFVVPFAFYVNNGVTFGGSTMTNMTRLMAVTLFSGQINNWDLFGPSFPNLHTVLCFRHAGSGTHATLDYAVVKGNGWGSSLPSYENRPDDNVSPYDPSQPDIYFNDQTGDELNCINGSLSGNSSYVATGAVGYADADKADFTAHTVSGYSNIKQVMYQGEYPSADGIKNGRYDFWTNEWAFKDPTYSNMTTLNSFVGDADNSSYIPGSETNFWVVSSDKQFDKATDKAYPSKK